MIQSRKSFGDNIWLLIWSRSSNREAEILSHCGHSRDRLQRWACQQSNVNMMASQKTHYNGIRHRPLTASPNWWFCTALISGACVRSHPTRHWKRSYSRQQTHTSYGPNVSAKNKDVKPPLSSNFAKSVQYERSRRLSFARSFGLRHWPKERCPTVNISKPFSKIFFFGLSPSVLPPFFVASTCDILTNEQLRRIFYLCDAHANS